MSDYIDIPQTISIGTGYITGRYLEDLSKCYKVRIPKDLLITIISEHHKQLFGEQAQKNIMNEYIADALNE